jgi:hypothetical protein
MAKKNARRKAGARKTRGAAPSRRAGKSTRRAVKARPRRAAKAAARKTVKRKPAARRRAVTPKKTARPAARKTAAARRPKVAAAKRSAAPKRPAAPKAAEPRRRPPSLDRERRTVRETVIPSPPSSLDLDRSASAARSGRAELNQKLHQHTSTGPALTGGDVDADWESAEAVGDEAPGGDNPTPDQDVVDEIGRALGVEYDDDEELRGGDEIVERDRKRWELDPASSDDFDER